MILFHFIIIYPKKLGIKKKINLKIYKKTYASVKNKFTRSILIPHTQSLYIRKKKKNHKFNCK